MFCLLGTFLRFSIRGRNFRHQQQVCARERVISWGNLRLRILSREETDFKCYVGGQTANCGLHWTYRGTQVRVTLSSYSHVPHNDVSTNTGPHIRRWSHNIIILTIVLQWGTAVVQWLRSCARNRKVARSIPAGVTGFFIDIKSFRSQYGPGVDSASNRNEYQEYFLGVKAAGV